MRRCGYNRDQCLRAKLNFAVAFLGHGAAAGAVLAAAAATLLIGNSPLASLYDRILGTPGGVRILPLAIREAAAAV